MSKGTEDIRFQDNDGEYITHWKCKGFYISHGDLTVTLCNDEQLTYPKGHWRNIHTPPVEETPSRVGEGVMTISINLSPDSPIHTNDIGGKQSEVGTRLDLVPAAAILAVGEVLKIGAERYEVDNWRKIETSDHLNHALVHIYAHLAGDNQDDHIEHAATRLLMALETHINPIGAQKK